MTADPDQDRAEGTEAPDPDGQAETDSAMGTTLSPELEQAVEEAADELGVDDPSVKDEVAQLVSAQYRGPLPPPAMLAAYDEVVPGLAERN